MQVQTLEYFRNTYGRAAMTVMHRMRTWHKQKAEKARKDGDAVSYGRHTACMMGLTSNIEAARPQRKAS